VAYEVAEKCIIEVELSISDSPANVSDYMHIFRLGQYEYTR